MTAKWLTISVGEDALDPMARLLRFGRVRRRAKAEGHRDKQGEAQEPLTVPEGSTQH